MDPQNRRASESTPLNQSQWVKDCEKEVRRGFIKKVYSILCVQLLLTVAIAYPLQGMSLEWLRSHVWIMYVSLVLSIVTLCAMSCCQGITRSFPTNYIFLFFFTAFEGVLIGFVSACYTAGSVAMCLGICAGIFLGLTIYAWTTDTDFTGMGPYLMGALLSLILFGAVISIMSMCGVPVKTAHIIYDILGILIFVFYIIFDTQLIIGGNHKNQFSIDDYVFAALNLYMDLINLFIHLLSLLGERR